MKVRSKVVDITKTEPTKDRYLVDTNVWLRLVYPPASAGSTAASPLAVYDQYFAKLLSVGADVVWCALSYFEIAHVIERTRCQVYNATLHTPLRLKAFRHTCQNERLKVLNSVQNAWKYLNSVGKFAPLTLDQSQTNESSIDFSNYCIDAYDAGIVRAMAQNGITRILTDDADYITVDRIEVHTANPRALQAKP